MQSLLAVLVSASFVAGAFTQQFYNLNNDILRTDLPNRRLKVRNPGRTRARIETEQCHVIYHGDAIHRISSNYSVCVYNGDYYEPTRQWIDNNKCMECACFAPDWIMCCKIKLIPTNLPDSCVIDPSGRRSRIPLLGTCLVPIVETSSLGRSRRPRPCRHRKFRQSLAGRKWMPDRRDPENYVISTKAGKSNAKRGAAAKVSVESRQRLLGLYMERLSRYPPLMERDSK